MKKNEIIFLGSIIVVLIVGLLMYWYWQTIPKDSEIQEATNSVKPADKSILSSKISQEINSREIFGGPSLEVPDNYNNEDPFF